MGNASMEVGDWLRSLGLSQYGAAFRENGVDADVLVDLSVADLEKLGVLPLGHRKRLLRAIAGLSTSAAGSSPSPAVNSRPAADTAERRQLTVMFCDPVGSTELAARLDPEDMRSIIAAYHKCCATLILGQGGFVAKYMGDGVLAYFGYPQAHEHDGQRAAPCAGGDRDGDRGGRRSFWFGRIAGTLGRGRHAKPRRAAARDRRTRQRRHRREHAQAAGRPVRVGRSQPAEPQGRRRIDARLHGYEGEFAGEPLRGAALGRGFRFPWL